MREGIIRLWFDMWLQQEDLGIDKIFTEDILYIESWGPTYEGRALVKHWFEEWNTRGKVLKWDIQQYFHQGDQTGDRSGFQGIDSLLHRTSSSLRRRQKAAF